MEHNNINSNNNKLVLSKQWFIDSHQGNIKDVYQFLERLGSGGFGVVYLAEHRITSKCHKIDIDIKYLSNELHNTRD